MANPVGPGGTWTQVFEDLFTGPGLNTANWTAVQGITNSNTTTQASSVSVSGGTCNIKLAGMINSAPALQGWGPNPSNGPQLLVGSCVEASINWPGFAGNSPYNWPAWWVSGANWPANGEEDIFESYNGTPSALNYHNASGANNGPFPAGNWCNSFHTYTLVRGSTTLSCYWDGVLVRQISRNDNGGPQSLIVFMANGNTSSGTAVGQVDYVRMWTPGGTGGSSPSVVTSAATAVTTTTVTLNGTVNPNSLATTYQFEYGTTTGYGTQVPGSPGSAGSGNAAISESAAVTGLTASTTYHYRLNGTNSAGTASGTDQAFTTATAGGGGGGGGGALPVLAYSNTATTTTAGTMTSTSFTPQAGDIIVVKLAGEDARIVFPAPAGGGWTYTSQLSDTTTAHVSARIYTAPVTAGGTPQTVTVTPSNWGANTGAMMTVELWRGAQLAATPATCDTRGAGAPSATLTTTAANSVVSWVNGDWAAVDGTSRVYRTTSATPSEDGYFFSTATMTAYAATQSAVTAGAQTLGLTAPAGQTYSLLGIELQAASSGGTGGGALSYRAAPAVTASSGNVSTWTVSKQAGTAAGDWIFIYLFGCDYSATVACAGFTVIEDPNTFGALIYRRADGTEGSSFTITGLGGASPVTTLIATVAGATTALDPAAAPTPNSGGPSTSIPVTGVTLTQPGDWLLWFAGNQNSFTGPGYAITPPPGFTSQATNGAAAANATVMLADNQSPGTGATGAETGTTATASYYSGVLAGVTAGTTGPASTPGAQPAGAAGAALNARVTTSGAAVAPAVLPSGTGRAIQPAAVMSGSATPGPPAASGAGAALNATVQAAPGIAWFPGTDLGVKTELLLNGTWTDITAYVYARNPVQISGMGRADWTSTIQAAQATLTLDNRTGRFSPKNSGGAYFPFITRNVQLRISVAAQSVTGQAYSGVRFWGEVAEWPPRWSASGRDVYADITAAGIWRRISQLQTTLGSAFTRYNSLTLTGSAQPRAYWPMEDGTGSGQLVSYDSVAGTQNAVQSFVTGQSGLSLAACTDFKGSDGIPQFNGATITATVPPGGTPAVNCTRFLLSVPAAGDSAQGTTAGNIAEIDSAGTVAKFEVYLNPGPGTLLMQLRNSGGTLLAAGTTTTNVKGRPVLVSCELTPSGGAVNFALRIITQNATGITESVTGTLASAAVGAITTVRFSRAGVLMDTAAGHLSVTYGAVPLMVPASYALGGYQGETAMDRFTRICTEMGIAAETTGTASTTAAMGPQVDDTLANLLQSLEDTDCGLLVESRTQFGLGYRSNASMANQPVAATFSYPGATLDPSLAPTYDDSLTRNNITVTNWTGYAEQAVLTAGAMSVLNPPAGVGNGYNYSRAVNAAADAQTAGIATFLLNQGTVDEIRFPVVTLKLARQSNAALFTAVPGLRIGDYFQITSPPSFLTDAANIRQLAWGYSETLGPREWTFSFNSVPETPWETGFSPGTTQIAQIPGGSAVTSTAPGAGGLGGIIANGSITPAMLSSGITVHTLGGNAITISANAPASPNTGDIWIASATGLLSQWDGAAWIPFKFDASQVIQTGTIVSSNIAASSITAGLLAAGITVSGIVDATTVKAAQYIAAGATGQFLAYTSTPAPGNLDVSISPAAGADSLGNTYAAGIEIQSGGLILDSQAGAPATVTGASTLYTSSGGRLRYLSSSGNDLVLDRSVLDLTTHSMGTQTTAQIMSSTLSYLANEAQAGSEYEIEIDGTITTPSSTTGTLPTYNFSFFIDGVGTGIKNVTFGAVMLSAGLTVAYCIRARLTLNTTGAGGSGNVAFDGGMSIQLNGATQFNLGNTSPGGGQGSTPVNQITTGVGFDTTANHSLAVYGNWGTSTGTSGTQSAITYRTKKTRRN